MATNKNQEYWKIASEGSDTQTAPKGFIHTLIVVVWFLLSLAIFILGLVLIFDKNIRADDAILAIVASIGITGLIYVFAVATRTTNRTRRVLIFGLLLIIGGIVLFVMGNVLMMSLKLATGFVGIVISLFMFVDVWREIKIEAPFIGSLIWGLVYLGLSLAILFVPDGTRILSVLTGFYLVMLALNAFFESLSALFVIKPKLKRNVGISLPMIVSAFLPMALFREVNTMVKEEPDELLKLQEPDKGKEPDLIVYIHTRAGFIPGFGHCDLCYKGKVYSYGDYDEATWKFGGFLADGTLALVPPEKHIEMALKDDKKILMAYGIQLTDKLDKAVRGELDKIMSLSYQWKPKAQLAAEGEISGDPKSFTDVGSKMYLEENAELFKFKDGSKYKTYYAIGENCSEVVNDVVGKSGLRLFKLNGIITPGTYLEYLNELYETEDSIVTDRRLYMLDKNGKPFLYPLNPKEPIKLGDLSM